MKKEITFKSFGNKILITHHIHHFLDEPKFFEFSANIMKSKMTDLYDYLFLDESNDAILVFQKSLYKDSLFKDVLQNTTLENIGEVEYDGHYEEDFRDGLIVWQKRPLADKFEIETDEGYEVILNVSKEIDQYNNELVLSPEILNKYGFHEISKGKKYHEGFEDYTHSFRIHDMIYLKYDRNGFVALIRYKNKKSKKGLRLFDSITLPKPIRTEENLVKFLDLMIF